ncbi:NAD(P)/FAD-dependent oxidoreductase [Arthrobacter sp. MA-N2]|uniref:NAD(P)/FAD-dependent oxidoreductase n=1 Tax=Arthrobacter sp. MA-N2 TaxID=1101188 RepID=UPI000486756A|nr:FAD-dependent oxidoreductase [Arthrobacter sp. MA-N2]
MDNIVIAGASTAGLTAARELRKKGFMGRLRLVEQDRSGPYRRPEVSKGLLSGALNASDIAIAWPADLDLELVLGARLEHLDVGDRAVGIRHDDGRAESLHFDRLLLATGCIARPTPFDPTIGRVHTLRSAQDAQNMKADLDRADRVAIIGGGFIGLEVAAVAQKLGKSVTVIEAAEIPLSRILGDVFGNRIAAHHQAHGVELITGASVVGLDVDGSNNVAAVALASGERIEADVVLMAIGSRPAIDWLESSGLPSSDGIECDETCAVEGTDGLIVAAGDLASWINPLYQRRMRVEHWTNAIEQGTYAARRLMGAHDPDGFVSAPYFWSDQHGVKIQSIGSSFGHDEAVVIDESDDSMLVAYGLNGRLLSVAGLNAGTRVMKHRRLVLEGASMTEVRGAAQLIG